MTLTLAHKGEALDAMLDRLYESFRELRSLPVWHRHVRGGVYAAQVTRNTKKGEWHAHLHIIVDGEYFPQNQLRDAWFAVTGDSKIVDIRPVPDRAKIAKYVAEYVSRPNEVACWGWAAIEEYAEAMHGRRLVHTFGSAHGIKVEDEDDGREPGGGTFVCDTVTLLRWRSKGDAAAVAAVRVLASLGPEWARVLVDRTEAWEHGGQMPDDQLVHTAIATARTVYLRPPDWKPAAAPPPRVIQPPLISVAGGEKRRPGRHATG
jgi:hypothetical protein